MPLRAYHYIRLLRLHLLKKHRQISGQYFKITIKQQDQFALADVEARLECAAFPYVLLKNHRTPDIAVRSGSPFAKNL